MLLPHALRSATAFERALSAEGQQRVKQVCTVGAQAGATGTIHGPMPLGNMRPAAGDLQPSDPRTPDPHPQWWEAAQAFASPRRLLYSRAALCNDNSSHGGAGAGSASSSGGGGLDAGAFVALLAQLLPGLAVWEAWDVWSALTRCGGGDGRSSGLVSAASAALSSGLWKKNTNVSHSAAKYHCMF
jgi:hypothetical protein